jgi:hypothetical protein
MRRRGRDRRWDRRIWYWQAGRPGLWALRARWGSVIRAHRASHMIGISSWALSSKLPAAGWGAWRARMCGYHQYHRPPHNR